MAQRTTMDRACVGLARVRVAIRFARACGRGVAAVFLYGGLRVQMNDPSVLPASDDAPAGGRVAYDCGHLPLEDRRRRDWGRWWASLAMLAWRPFSRPVHIREPVGHTAVVKLMWAVRWPTWLLCAVPIFVVFGLSIGGRVLGVDGLEVVGAQPGSSDGGGLAALALKSVEIVEAPGALGGDVPGSLAQSLRVWLLLMVPLGIPLVYFAAGMTAHVVLVLTGGAPRSMGTTMRAVGLAFILPSLCYGLMDVGVTYGVLPPLGWGVGFLVITAWLGGRMFFGVRCLQGLARRRSLAVIPPALLVLTLGVLMRAALVLPYLPGAEVPATQRYHVEGTRGFGRP